MATKYIQIKGSEVPARIRFDVPRQNQGQIVEVAYGDSDRDKSENCYGAPYMRVTDRSDRSVEYYRAIEVAS